MRIRLSWEAALLLGVAVADCSCVMQSFLFCRRTLAVTWTFQQDLPHMPSSDCKVRCLCLVFPQISRFSDRPKHKGSAACLFQILGALWHLGFGIVRMELKSIMRVLSKGYAVAPLALLEQHTITYHPCSFNNLAVFWQFHEVVCCPPQSMPRLWPVSSSHMWYQYISKRSTSS